MARNPLAAFLRKVKEKRAQIDYRYGLGRLERTLATNWLNPFLTVWVNLRSFPIRQAWKMPVAVYGRPRIFALSGTMKVVDAKVSPGMIRFNRAMYGGPEVNTVQSSLTNIGSIVFHGPCDIGTGNKILVKGTLDVGNHLYMSDRIIVSCFLSIKLGHYTRIAHRCQIMDSNYHYVANLVKRTSALPFKPVSIGHHCWICNSSTITHGSVVPDLTIVSSNSMVNRDFSELPPYTLLGGIPAKPIASGLVRVWDAAIEQQIWNHYAEHPDSPFTLPDDFQPVPPDQQC